MKRFKKVMVCLLMVSFIALAFGVSAQAADYSIQKHATGPSMAADLFIARPLGLISTVAGTAVFIVSLPFSALGGNVEPAADEMVVKPVRYTFLRPLGVF